MFHTIKYVKPLDNFILLITFKNKETKYYDVKKSFNKFENLQKLECDTRVISKC